MSRDMTPAMEAATLASEVHPILFAEIGVSTGFIRVHTGIGDITFNGEVFQGVGEFGGVSEIVETEDVEANGLVFILSGVPAVNIAVAFNSMEQGLPAILWIGAFDLTTRALIVDPVLVYEGLTDVPEIDETGETAAFAINTENRLIQLERPKTRRYTDLDQKLDFATDRGFEFVPSLQDRQVKFGP